MHIDYWLAGVTGFIVLLNGLYAGLLVALLRRREPRPRFIERAVCAWAVFVSLLLLVQIYLPGSWQGFMRHWLYLPLAVEMVWNLLFVQTLVLVMIVITLLVRHFRPVTKSPQISPEGISRRKFVYLLTCGAAPTASLALGVHGVLQYHDLRVRLHSIPVAGLPPELEGFTIAHVSDLHSGIFCGPSRLKNIRDATNDLKADLVVITGDIINREMSEFPAAVEAILGIESRHGTYLCEGNHDCIPGYGVIEKACARHQLPLLYNSTSVIAAPGGRLLLGGLPWMKKGFEGRPEIVSRLYPPRKQGDVRILLAHHPHLFDIAQSSDLVLSGHTHGGQIMLSDTVGCGPLFFKYWSGAYHRGSTTLVVSNGCGDWFPCRVGAPAEIGLLRLTRVKDGITT